MTRYTGATPFLVILAMLLLSNCSEKKKDNTDLLVGFALASQSTNSETIPYQLEAASAGFTVPNVPVRGVSTITLSNSGTSQDIRNLFGSTLKKDIPTTEAGGTCFLTISGISSCSYNFPEKACTTLANTIGISKKDFTTDATNATCNSKGCNTECSTAKNTTVCSCEARSISSLTKASYLFSAASGVVSYVFSLNPTEIGTSTFTVQLSINGQSSEVNFSALSGVQTTNRMVLNAGRNYAWITVSSGGSVITRSEVYRIDSTVATAPLRTELSWNGTGDIDLIVDDGNGGRKVYWLEKTNTSTGFNIALDVDNTVAYGPENIRVFTSPSGSNYRFFANYYSGSNSLTATAKVYTGTTLINTKTLLFTSSDSSTSNSFDSKSKLIGNYTVNGTTAVGASITEQ